MDNWIGLIGVVAGVCFSQGFNLWNEKRRHDREDQLRFVDQRRIAYPAPVL